MKMGELCNRSVVIARPEESVREAALRMRHYHVGCLVVVQPRDDANVPVAMVTDRDLVVAALAAEGERPWDLPLSTAMSGPLVAAQENEDVYDVIQRMRARGVRRVPVVDAEGHLQGIFTFDDILEYLTEQLEGLAALLQRERRGERDVRP